MKKVQFFVTSGIIALFCMSSPMFAQTTAIQPTETTKSVSRGPRGPRGHEGDRGHRGPEGDRGHRGPEGDRGHRGHKGHQGPAGTGGIGPQGVPGATGPQGFPGATGATGSSAAGFFAAADFYALMPPDDAAPAFVPVGAAMEFPQTGPITGSGISRLSNTQFTLAAVGTYQVLFQASVSAAGQLVVGLDAVSGTTELPATVVGRATGTSQIVGMSYVTTTVPNSVLTIRNPALNTTPLIITPLAGGTNPVSAHLVITRVQ